MEYRLSTYSDLNGHALGNLILTALLKETNSFKTSIEYLSKLLHVKHSVLPLSEDCLTLMGETTDGEIIEGEENITKANKEYSRIFYKENPHVFPEVFDKINDADLIIISMGSLYTSVMPHLICPDVVKAIKDSKAKIMYICNAMTQPGETDNFTVNDHVQTLEKYLGKDTINAVVATNTIINDELLDKYATEEQKDPVIIDYANIIKENYELLEGDLLTAEDGTIRHDSLKLSSIIFSYLMR